MLYTDRSELGSHSMVTLLLLSTFVTIAQEMQMYSGYEDEDVYECLACGADEEA